MGRDLEGILDRCRFGFRTRQAQLLPNLSEPCPQHQIRIAMLSRLTQMRGRDSQQLQTLLLFNRFSQRMSLKWIFPDAVKILSAISKPNHEFVVSVAYCYQPRLNPV